MLISDETFAVKRFLPGARSLFAVAFLILLALVAWRFVKRGAWRGANALAGKLPAHHFLVDLNGGVHRVVGRRFCNAVYRSPEGILLSEFRIAEDVSQIVEHVAAFDAWLKERRIPYVYVQTPAKTDMTYKMLPDCFAPSGNRQVDAMLTALAERNVRTIDLRAKFTATPEDVGRFFYKTDHHWNNDAVFKALGALVPEIAHACDMDPSPAKPFVSPRAWHREVWPQCFMGSKARRTGLWFGGLDDLVVYTPKFPTEMSIEIPSKGINLSGDFCKTIMWHSGKVRKGAAGFCSDAYSLLYVGGIYGVVRHVNRQAPLNLRLLIVGDSFVRPLEALLATVVNDLLVVDPRRLGSDETVAGFVESFKPGLVLQVNNPSALGGPKTRLAILFRYGELR